MLDDIIEFLVELVFEGLFDLSVGAATSKKVPMPVRIFLAAIIALFALSVVGIILYAAIIEESILLTLLAAFMAIGFVYTAVKKYNQMRSEEDK